MSKHGAKAGTSKTVRKIAAIAVAPVAIAALTSVVFGFNSAAKATDTGGPKHLKPAPEPQAQTPRKLPRPSDQGFVSKYSVSEGDTLKDVANQFGVSTAELLAANGLSWRTMLAVGQELRIPQDTSGTSSPSVSSDIRSHRVIAGDTLEAIARSHRVQPRAIISANGLHRTSRLVIGQRLVIPNAELMETLPALQNDGVSA